VEAFSRAFLSAGAGATVTTLWRVEDSSAAEFMKQFYARLARGQTPAEALRGAKLAFLRSGQPFADPRHWAAFVLNGGGQRRLPRAISWTELAAAAAVASVLGFLLARRRRRRA
jgi:hypothetical protein